MPSSARMEAIARLQARIRDQEQFVDSLTDETEKLEESSARHKHCLHLLSLATEHLNVLMNCLAAMQLHLTDNLHTGEGLKAHTPYQPVPARQNSDAHTPGCE
jgi:hypothetical protein